MSTEIELKYKAESPAAGKSLLNSSFINEISISDSRDFLDMRAVYYDDRNRTLTSGGIGCRIRNENGRFIATVKWNSAKDSSGFSKRCEYNAEVKSEYPDFSVFKEIIQEKEFADLITQIRPEALFVTEFRRELVLVNYRNSIIEAAFDCGNIISESGASLPICELEFELKSGSEEELQEFGRIVSEKFSLTPLNVSKLKRGLDLISE
ncbi:MAG: CYTH domain-containing protein [Bacillota bacterium]|nr:CYTH domain-containing protein [Bacillota bacterium]